MFIPELEDDSEDLTDEEVESAIAVANVDAMLKRLRDARCPECEKEIEVFAHALRRRVPFLYARMDLQCQKEHSHTIIFRADWLSS